MCLRIKADAPFLGMLALSFLSSIFFSKAIGQRSYEDQTLPGNRTVHVAENASISDFRGHFDQAVQLLKQEGEDSKKQGMDIISFLALELNQRINEGKFSVRDKETIQLLKDFEAYQFYIGRPKHNYLTKVLIYTCEGRYSYVFYRFRNSKAFYPGIFLISVTVLILILSLTNTIGSRLLRKLSKLTVFGVGLFLIVFLCYKVSCSACIDNYTFYGIPIM